MKTRASLLFALLLASGCGISEPENIVFFSGTIVAAEDGAGYTAGQPVAGAQLTLRYVAPLDLSVTVRDDDVSDATGAWAVQSGPPPGQRDPDCRQLTLAVVAVGFRTTRLLLSTVCAQGAGTFDGIEIAVTPEAP